jgi:hypothetical protein
MSRLVAPLLAVVIVAAATLSIRADACTPRPKPSPAVPLVSIDLTGETVTADAANASISPIDYGSDISLTIAKASAPRTYGLSIPLSSDDTLTVLSAGGAAITQTLPIPLGDYSGLNPPADYQDNLDQVHSDAPIETTPDDGSPDIEDNQDPSWYPSGDQVEPDTRDGGDIASDALTQVESQIPDGNYVMTAAFDPPLATDANGQAVPVSLARSSGGLTVSVTPSGAAAFPIELTLRYGYDPDSYGPAAPNLSTTRSSLKRARSASIQSTNLRSLLARAAAKCPGQKAQVVISASSGSMYLTDAFRRYPTSCAVYYVSVAPVKSDSSQRPRGPHAVQVINALNKKVTTKKEKRNYPHWNTSGAGFTPIAEINYENIPDSYRAVGSTFARQARTLGYGMWSIDEVPCDLVNNPTSRTWNRVVDLAQGLSQNGNVKGIVFNCYRRQDASQDVVRAVKKNTKILFSDSTNFDWSQLSATKLWAEEAYTFCSRVCVKEASLGRKAMTTNAYMQHSARLAFAPDAPTTGPTTVEPVRNLLRSRFLPLINGWGAVAGNSSGSNAYGTYHLTTEQIRRLVSLQTFAGRAWVRPENLYSALRIGVRWVDRLQPDNGWKGPNRAALARRIAGAIAGAYGPNGTSLGACDPTGGGSTKLCQPAVNGAQLTDAWAAFRRWNSTICPSPSNDNFADAKSLTSVTDSVEGTLNCATWEPPSETAPGGGTKSVWYRWTAPQDGDFAFGAYDSDDGLQTNVYTGDSLGNLHAVYRNFFDNSCRGFPATEGTTYKIQVVNTHPGGATATAGAFTLGWGLAGCYD